MHCLHWLSLTLFQPSFSKYSQLWLLCVSFDVWSLELLVSFLNFCNHSDASVPGLHWLVSINSGPRKEQWWTSDGAMGCLGSLRNVGNKDWHVWFDLTDELLWLKVHPSSDRKVLQYSVDGSLMRIGFFLNLTMTLVYSPRRLLVNQLIQPCQLHVLGLWEEPGED